MVLPLFSALALLALNGATLQLHDATGIGTIEFEATATGTLSGDATSINSSVPLFVAGVNIMDKLESLENKLAAIAPHYQQYVSSVESIPPTFTPTVEVGIFSSGVDCLTPQLTSVVLSSVVSTIGTLAFFGCPRLSSVTLPDSVTVIGERAFQNLPLTSMKIPATTTSVGREAFRGASLATSLIFDYASRGVGFNISTGAFRGTSVTSVNIPDAPNGVPTSIGPGAFMDCRLLTSVTIGTGVEEIGDGAFAGHHTFSNQYSCQNGEYDYRVSSSGSSNCLQYNYNDPIPSVIESLTLGSTLKRIGVYAFAWNSKLTTVTFPSSLVTIGHRAFYENEALTSIDFGTASSLVTIGAYAFAYANLTSVVLPDSVTEIGYGAFNYNRHLASVVLPASLKKLSGFGYTALTSIQIPSSVTHIGSSAFADPKFTSIVIPDSVIEIGYNAFAGREVNLPGYGFGYTQTSLTSLTLGAGVVSIGDKAFAGANITSLTLPSSVTTVGRSAFANCTQLTSLVIQSSTIAYADSSPFGSSSYSSLAPITSITLPTGSDCYQLTQLSQCSTPSWRAAHVTYV